MSPEKVSKPQYKFTVSMFPEEARARKLAATETRGVTFEELTRAQAERRGLNVRILLSRRVIGITTAENDDALDKFNTALKKIYTPYRKGSS